VPDSMPGCLSAAGIAGQQHHSRPVIGEDPGDGFAKSH
jgi:hypothetical protein